MNYVETPSVYGTPVIAPELIEQARQLDQPAGVTITYHVAPAEETGLPDNAFDTVTPEAWRGRIRASAGVSASLSPAEVQQFDTELASILTRDFPQNPLDIHHRVWAVIARNPAPQSQAQ